MTTHNVYQPGLIQVRPQWNTAGGSIFGQPENIMWWQGSNLTAFPLDPTQLAVIAADFDAAWAVLWKHAGNTNYEYVGSIITDWSIATGIEFSSVGSFTPVQGLATVDHTAATSILTSFKSSTMPKYRGGHPRLYLPLIGATMDDEYNFQGTVISTMTTDWAAVDTAMAGAGSLNGGPYAQMVYRFRNDITRAHLYAVTHRTVQKRAATQRRRLRKTAHT